MDLKELHNRGDLKAYDLARYLGVSHTCVYNWINGKAEPKYSQMKKIEEFLGK